MSSPSKRKGMAGMGAASPLAIVVPLVIVGLIFIVLAGRRGAAAAEKNEKKEPTAGGVPLKMLLSVAIQLLDNDIGRRVVLMGLKAARNHM